MTYDLNFMAATKDPAEVPLAFDNNVCEGAYKLAQRVLVLLFKDNESALIDELGTDILEISTGNIWAEDTLQNDFNIAADEVREAIQNDVNASSLPEDEQLDSLVIDVTFDEADRTRVLLEITIETVSGDAINSTVPYKLNGE